MTVSFHRSSTWTTFVSIRGIDFNEFAMYLKTATSDYREKSESGLPRAFSLTPALAMICISLCTASVYGSTISDIELWKKTKDIPSLINALNDGDSSVRMSAVSALSGFNDVRAVDGLLQAMTDEESNIRWAAAQALQKAGSKRVADRLIEYLGHWSTGVREVSVWTLGEIDDPRVEDKLVFASEDRDPSVRMAAVYSLERHNTPRTVLHLIKTLSDAHFSVREAAVWTLGKFGDRRAVGPVMKVLNDESSKVREAAAWTLGWLGDRRAVGPLINALSDDAFKVREAAAYTLSELGDTKAVTPLIEGLGRGPSETREKIAMALTRLGEPLGQLIYDSLEGSHKAREQLLVRKDPRAIFPLVRALKDSDQDVRRAAAATLGAIGDPVAVTALEEMANQWTPLDRLYAITALAKIKQKDYSGYLLTALRVLFGSPAGIVYSLSTLWLIAAIAVPATLIIRSRVSKNKKGMV